MRKIIFSINLTADGCCDHTAGIPDDDVMDYYTRLMQSGGALLYGRKTYELMFPYWPDLLKEHTGPATPESRFAEAFVAVPEIIVVSKTLEKVEGKNSKIIRSNLQEEIKKLKSGTGKDILAGGVSLPTELLELGLIDELRLVIHPIVVGKGRRLFDTANLQEKLKLKLAESQVFESGFIALRYLKA